jgi:hypothetical protein
VRAGTNVGVLNHVGPKRERWSLDAAGRGTEGRGVRIERSDVAIASE